MVGRRVSPTVGSTAQRSVAGRVALWVGALVAPKVAPKAVYLAEH